MDCENSSSSNSSDSEEDIENMAAYMALNSNIINRSIWVHEINMKREEFGEYSRLVQELRKHPGRFHMYFRMSEEKFEYIHSLIENDIQKQNTQFRKAISTREKLAVTLRFLATGNSFRSVGFSYRLGFSTVREIVRDVCDSIWKRLSPIVMPTPTEEDWKNIAEKYKELWNFPNCIGAIDGKHVNIQCPINAGSSFYNYKGNHSVVLLALVDATYKFVAIDVGSYGRNSDGSIFAKSALGRKLEQNAFNVPEDTPLIENGEKQPYVIVGDEAFPLKTYLLRPYSRHNLGENEPNKIFNYRLSRARRVVENAFGILAARWRIFRKHLEVQPQMVDKVVLAACCLHNLLCDDNAFEPDFEALNLPNAALLNLNPLRRNSTHRAFHVRDNFKEYFNSVAGSVPWQLQRVRRGRLQNNE